VKKIIFIKFVYISVSYCLPFC